MDHPTDSAPVHRHRVRRVLVALVVVASLVVAGVWYWAPPDRTFEAGYGIGVKRGVGVRTWTVIEHGQSAEPGRIYVEDIEPQFDRDGAEVEVEYVICRLDAGTLAADGVSSSGYGMRDGAIERYCTFTTPAEGASFRLGAKANQELLVAVTPTRPGRSVVNSHRLTYSEGWRRGTADIHATIDVTAS